MHSTSARSAVLRLAVARFVSLIGAGAGFTALMFDVYDRTGSAVWLSAALLAYFGTIAVLSPLAGLMADRFDRRRLMIASDLAAAGAWVALAFAGSPAVLVVLSVAGSVAMTPFLVAASASVPSLAGPDRLAWANAVIGVGRNAGLVAGPPLGGLLAAGVGPSSAFLVNSLSFLTSALIVLSIRRRFSGARTGQDEHSGARAGLAFVLAEPVLRRLFCAWILLHFGAGVVIVIELPLAVELGAGSGGYGLMIAVWSAGAAAGSLAVRRLRPGAELPAVTAGFLTVAAGFGVVALAPWFALVLPAMLAGGLGEGLGSAAEQCLVQRTAPDAVLGRVLAAFDAVAQSAFAVAFALAGLLEEEVGPRPGYVLAAAVALAGALWLAPLRRPAPSPA